MSYTNKNLTTKKCNICQSYLPLDAMVKNYRYKDGIAPLCKECNRKRYAQRKKLEVKGPKENDFSGEWLGASSVYL